ncbi:MAG: flagellar hook-associated protein 3, partial [Clostridiales bacterium]|nr:flagellar hook-associated protein 3 [Clostridiales bacterium]
TVEGFTIRENGYALDLSRLGYADGVKSARNQLQSIEYEVGVGNKVKVNLEGSEVFSEIGGLEGLFETFRKLEMALNGETAYKTARMDADTGTVVVETHTMKVDDMLADFDKDLDRLLKVRSDMGARLNYLELTDNRLRDDYINFTSLKSKNEDVDMAEIIMQLKIEENVYRASLAAGARVIQPTLLDFLR